MNGTQLLHFTEIAFFIVSLLTLGYLIYKKDFETVYNFITGFIFGIVLELVSVNLLGGYHYNPDYFLNIGNVELLKHFPLFGGFMWGGLMSLSNSQAKKFQKNWFITGLITYFLVIGWDLMFDVIAVRIDGGLWVWDNAVIDYSITKTSLYGVNYSNYFNYLAILIPYTFFCNFNRKNFNLNQSSVGKNLLFSLINFVEAFVGFICILIPFRLLNRNVCDEGFYRPAFIIVFIAIFLYILFTFFKKKVTLMKKPDIGFMIMYIGCYVVSIVTCFITGVANNQPWFFIVHLIILAITILIGTIDIKTFKTK